jgi:hypothetical protein
MKLTRNQRRQLEKLAPHVDRITQGDGVFLRNTLNGNIASGSRVRSKLLGARS